MTDQQINQMVYERYPVIDRERNCRTERAFREKLREEYRDRLRNNMQTETKEGEKK